MLSAYFFALIPCVGLSGQSTELFNNAVKAGLPKEAYFATKSKSGLRIVDSRQQGPNVSRCTLGKNRLGNDFEIKDRSWTISGIDMFAYSGLASDPRRKSRDQERYSYATISKGRCEIRKGGITGPIFAAGRLDQSDATDIRFSPLDFERENPLSRRLQRVRFRFEHVSIPRGAYWVTFELGTDVAGYDVFAPRLKKENGDPIPNANGQIHITDENHHPRDRQRSGGEFQFIVYGRRS